MSPFASLLDYAFQAWSILVALLFLLALFGALVSKEPVATPEIIGLLVLLVFTAYLMLNFHRSIFERAWYELLLIMILSFYMSRAFAAAFLKVAKAESESSDV